MSGSAGQDSGRVGPIEGGAPKKSRLGLRVGTRTRFISGFGVLKLHD